RRTKWIRAERGGLVDLIAQPGQFLEAGAPMATTHTPFGREVHQVLAPFDCVVIGATTVPTMHPGDPIFNIGRVESRRKELKENPLPPRL
ncbi:MAG TPA: succinate dehydrogenase, partial [bacterium]|nr:succinate dehydrogenase [bacterium]